MSIDWFTTSAQILNFLILVWLLKKLLFKPIVGAMENREQGLANRQQQVENEMIKAQSLKNQYANHLQQLNIEKDQVLSQARQQAKAEKARILQGLSDEILHKKNQFDAEIRKEQHELGPLIRRTIVEKSLSLTRKILTQLADQTLEQRIIEHFLQQLSNLSGDDQASIKKTLKKDAPATIITGFEPDTGMQKQIENWFNSFQPNSKLLFEQRDYLLSGIALEAGGRSWEWNIDRYLTELETELL